MKKNVFLILILFNYLFLEASYGSQHCIIDVQQTDVDLYRKICVSPRFQGGDGASEESPTESFTVYNNYKNMFPVKDQGPLGTCVSFVASACGEYYYKRNFSEAEFTILTQTNEHLGNQCKGGLSLGNALEVAKQYGFVEEDRLLYDDYLKKLTRFKGLTVDDLNENSTICKRDDYNGTMRNLEVDLQLYNSNEDFTKYRLKSLYPIYHSKISNDINFDKVKCFLNQGYPIACAVNIYRSADRKTTNWDDDELESNYTIKAKSKNQVSKSSHAVILCGYNELGFLLRNSWGTQWGKNGYAYITYNYTKKHVTELIAVGRPATLH